MIREGQRNKCSKVVNSHQQPLLAINPLFIVKYQHHDDEEDIEKYLCVYVFVFVLQHTSPDKTRNVNLSLRPVTYMDDVYFG